MCVMTREKRNLSPIFALDRYKHLQFLILTWAALLLCPTKLNAEPLETTLYRASTRYDCYFTLEVSSGADLEVDLALPDNRHDFIAQLSTKLPDFVIEPDVDIPVVVHIRDKLVRQSSLDQKIELTYDGKVSHLPSEMGRVLEDGKLINALGSTSPAPPYHYDEIGMLRVRKRTATIQSLMSNLMPLSRHDAILWFASSSVDNGKPRTALRLGQRGLQDFPFKDRGNHPAEPFRSGIAAYAFTPDTKAAEDEAIQFIQAELTKPSPQNIRWAMLWLGQWKVTSSIGLLIQDINYRYTTSWLVDESYPAVHAIEMMGNAAIQPVADAIQKETKPERLNLLYHSLVALRMDAHAKPDVEKLKADVQDGAKQKALLAVADALDSGSEPFAYLASENVSATQR